MQEGCISLLFRRCFHVAVMRRLCPRCSSGQVHWSIISRSGDTLGSRGSCQTDLRRCVLYLRARLVHSSLRHLRPGTMRLSWRTVPCTLAQNSYWCWNPCNKDYLFPWRVFVRGPAPSCLWSCDSTHHFMSRGLQVNATWGHTRTVLSSQCLRLLTVFYHHSETNVIHRHKCRKSKCAQTL